MKTAVADPKIVKLDVRDVDEWIGESSSPQGKDFCPRKGRIPGAVWIERQQTPTSQWITARLFRGEHPELALAALRRRLNEGEQAVIEPGSPPAIRIVLAQRLQLRGGRTWIRGSTDEPCRKVNPSLVTALRRAHADLLELKASPLSDPTNHVEATAPATQHERELSRMVFLAPELQRQILSGDQPAGLKLGAMLKTEMPLAWADQHEWIRTIGGLQRTIAISLLRYGNSLLLPNISLFCRLGNLSLGSLESHENSAGYWSCNGSSEPRGVGLPLNSLLISLLPGKPSRFEQGGD